MATTWQMLSDEASGMMNGMQLITVLAQQPSFAMFEHVGLSSDPTSLRNIGMHRFPSASVAQMDAKRYASWSVVRNPIGVVFPAVAAAAAAEDESGSVSVCALSFESIVKMPEQSMPCDASSAATASMPALRAPVHTADRAQ